VIADIVSVYTVGRNKNKIALFKLYQWSQYL